MELRGEMVIETNQDLYQAVVELGGNAAFSSRPLEDYLMSLWLLGRERNAVDSFSAAEFFDLLSQAGTSKVPPFEEDWRARYPRESQEDRGFTGWEARILCQIVDLRELQESGILYDKHRYFGVRSPRGQNWYNFSPSAFLECGVAGYFRGWSPDMDGSEVTIIGMKGKIEKRPSAEFSKPASPLERVTWDDFRDFLKFGQAYE